MDLFHSFHIQLPPAKKIKRVLTVHDCRYLAFPGLYNKKEVKSYRMQMEISLARANQVVTVSEFTKKELIKFFSYPEDRIQTIYNGFSPYDKTVVISGQKERIVENLSLTHAYLLYVGGVDPRKNLTRLIEAIALCKADDKEFPDLVIIGIAPKIWSNSNQAKRARKLGIFDHIHSIGMIEKRVLCHILKDAQALCYPSLYEGFGFPPLEAMSLGVPVLSGNSSSIPEVVGNAACLVDPTNVEDIATGLKRIVFDNEYRKILVDMGFYQIRKFSWLKAAGEYINLYNDIISS